MQALLLCGHSSLQLLQHSPRSVSPNWPPCSTVSLSWVQSFPRLASFSLPSLIPPHFSLTPCPPGAPADDLHEARTALALVLSQTGASNDVAQLIVSRAPACVQSLIDAARELDEFASWNSDLPSVHTNFRERVYEVARTSRSRQIGAFIESVGIEQRHVSRICHILASQELPDLLEKVHFLEELFPDDKDEGIITRVRRMMRELSINADEGLQKTLSFFEKMEARRGGINMLRIPRNAISHLIEEFPQVLLKNLDSDLKPLVAYLEEIGVPKEHMASVILCFPSTLLYGSKEELQSRLRRVKKVGVKAGKLGKMIVKYPWMLSRNVEHNVEDIAAFLIMIKVPKGKVGLCITKCPNLLGSSPRTLEVMVHRLNLFGVKSKRLGYLIAHSPQLLLKTPRAFNEVIEYLEGLGLEEDNMEKLLRRSPEIFASNVLHLEKKITILQEFGIPNHRLKVVVLKYPQVLMMSVEASLKPRLEFFRSMGLSKADISFMVCGFPPLLGYSIDKVLKPKLDFLENVICQPVKEVVMYPRYFSCGLKEKIIPRFRTLKRLNIDCELRTMLSKSDVEFAADYLGFVRMLVPPI